MEAPKQKAENQLSEKDLEAVKESIRIEQEETKTRKREASDKELLEDGANYKVNEHGTRLDPTDKQFEEIRKELEVGNFVDGKGSKRIRDEILKMF